jgi:hypothetical protein
MQDAAPGIVELQNLLSSFMLINSNEGKTFEKE